MNLNIVTDNAHSIFDVEWRIRHEKYLISCCFLSCRGGFWLLSSSLTCLETNTSARDAKILQEIIKIESSTLFFSRHISWFHCIPTVFNMIINETEVFLLSNQSTTNISTLIMSPFERNLKFYTILFLQVPSILCTVFV